MLYYVYMRLSLNLAENTMNLFTPHEAPATDLNSLPLQHPGRPIGRDSALREAYTILQSSAPLLLLGASGMGKTALAAALAAAYTQKSGGVLWLNAEGRSLNDLLSQVGRAYRAPEVTNTDQLSAMMSGVQALLNRHQPLIVLDCVRQPAPQANVIAPFVEKVARGLPLMILSETPLEGLGQSVTLGPLVDVDALTLLQQKAGIADDSQDLHLYGIAKLVGYNPLGLVIAARGLVAAKLPPADYYKALDTVAKTQKDGLAAAIATSYRALNNALQGLALLLSATPRGEVGVDLLAHLSSAPADNIDQAMNLLAQLYLVERFTRYGRPYYRMHARVRAFARDLLQGSNRLDGLVEKVRDGLLAYLKQAIKTKPTRALPPKWTPSSAWPKIWLTRANATGLTNACSRSPRLISSSNRRAMSRNSSVCSAPPSAHRLPSRPIRRRLKMIATPTTWMI